MDFLNYTRSNRNSGKFDTQREYISWLNRLLLLDCSRYQWKGLPLSCDERILEMNLTFNGVVCFFKDDVMDAFYTLPVNLGGNFNIYGIPWDRHVYSRWNGYHNIVNPYNSVLIYNNYFKIPHSPTLETYARRLTEIERTIDINVHAQRTPILIKTTREQQLTMENLYKQYDEFLPRIIADEMIGDLSSFQVLKTDAPYLADRLDVLLHNVYNEALSFMGYDNANQDKKERLVASETDGNNGQIKGQRTEGLIMRRKAAQEISALFDLDVSVDIRPDISVSSVDGNNYTYMYRNYDTKPALQGGEQNVFDA